MWNEKNIAALVKYREDGMTWAVIAETMLEVWDIAVSGNNCRKCYYRTVRDNVRKRQIFQKEKVLLLDIETGPLVAEVWGLFDQNIGLGQVLQHSTVLSWSAKWLGSDEVFYEDNSKARNVRDDKKLLKGIWKLIDEADVLLFQNGVSFDRKVLNARFIQNGFAPTSSCRYIDTMRIAKRHFRFDSNKLEHLTGILCTEHRKLSHAKFAGHKLWRECLKGNAEAWVEMKEYNIADVLSMEELYYKLRPWDKSLNFNVHTNSLDHVCSCGSTSFKKHGFVFTNTAKKQRYICTNCGQESVDNVNLLSKEKRKSLRK